MPSIYNSGPVTTVGGAPTNNANVNALISGTKWGGAMGSSTTVTFSFPTTFIETGGFLGFGQTGSFSYAGEVASGRALTTEQQGGIRAALQSWANVSNLTFVEIADRPDTEWWSDNSSVGDLRFAEHSPSEERAHAYNPSSSPEGGDVWFSQTRYDHPVAGNDAFRGMVHEIGHALGLEHPFEGRDGDTMASAYDTHKYTVMSYTGIPSDYVASGPMLLDIAAIQNLYGINWNYHSGNDTYAWTNGAKIFQCIWDGGGNDTIDASNQGQAVALHLTSGMFSTIGTAVSNGTRDNLSIAFNALIENATGTALDDAIYGNAYSNVLNGGAGNDTLRGSEWSDQAWDVGDTMHGNDGNDFMGGHGGNDLMYGDAGADTVIGDAGDDWLSGGTGDDYLIGDYGDGTGTGNDTMYGDAGADRMEGGRGNDKMVGGADANFSGMFFTFGDVSTDTMSGGAGDDSMYGGAGDDIIKGDDGNDILDGQYGSDRLDGGLGNDTLWGRTGNDLLDGNRGSDVVYGGSGDDTLTGGMDSFVYNGIEFGDVAVDSLYGEDGNDVLRGGAGNDWLYGGAGNDTLDGQAGADTLYGGAGDDVYYVGALDAPLEFAGEGNDLMVATADGLILGANIETMRLNNLATILTAYGTAGNETIYGNDYANTIDGRLGSDTIYGGAGNDALWGANSASTTDGGDLLDGQTGDDLIGGSYGNDTLVGGLGNDALYGDEGNDTLRGGDGDDLLRGDWGWGADLAGADSLDGGTGNDTLYGGAGTDTLTGGTGNDRLDGGTGTDTASYAAATAGIVVNLATTVAQNTVGAGIDTLAGIENVTGSGWADALVGDALANVLVGLAGDDRLSGMDGNDILWGGAGTDVLDGGNGSDTAWYINAASGVVVNLSSTAAQNTVGAGVDTLLSIERLVGSSYADTLYGNTLSNVLSGDAGNDRIVGAGGVDTLSGGSGGDVFAWLASALNSADVTAGGSDVISDFAAGDAIDLSAGLESQIRINGVSLAALTTNTAIGSSFGASTNICLSGNKLWLDCDNSHTITAQDFSIGFGTTVAALTYNPATDWLFGG